MGSEKFQDLGAKVKGKIQMRTSKDLKATNDRYNSQIFSFPDFWGKSPGKNSRFSLIFH